jgi:hypothetical protein
MSGPPAKGRAHCRGENADAAVAAARVLNAASGLLSLSVLIDSGLEHYRGSFKNKAMYTPLAVSSLGLAANLHGLADSGAERSRARDAAYALAAASGVVGTGFHAYNITKRPGGLSWLNLFYAAPPGAPAALGLAGLLGAAAERVRATPTGEGARLVDQPAGRLVGILTALGLAGTATEAGLLHFRGAFQNPAMLAAVGLPPVAAALLGLAAAGRAGKRRPFARLGLGLTAALGIVGVGFHIWGVSRHRGGWRNWRQTLLAGPPVPAPPAFAALALAGLAALTLMERADG